MKNVPIFQILSDAFFLGRAIDPADQAGRVRCSTWQPAQAAMLLLDCGFAVRAVDYDTSGLLPLAGPSRAIIEIDLESGGDWPLGDGYDGIVTNQERNFVAV